MANHSSERQSVYPPLWILTTAGAVLIIWLLYSLKEIVVLLVVGYCVAYLIDPILVRFEKRGISRTWGVISTFAIAIIVITLLVLLALPTLSREFDKLSNNLPAYVDDAKSKLGPLYEQLRDLVRLPQKDPPELVGSMPSVTGQNVKGLFVGVGQALIGGYNLVLLVVNLALLPFIVFYLAVDLPSLHNALLLFFPQSARARVRGLAGEIDRYVSAFVRGQLIVGAISSAIYCVGLNIIGVELWGLLAIISGFGNLIPYVGLITGLLLSSVMVIVAYGDLAHLFQVIGLFVFVQILEGTVTSPKIVGNRVGLSPLTVILAIFAGGKLFGILGVFLAIPGVAIIKVLGGALHGWLITRAEHSVL